MKKLLSIIILAMFIYSANCFAEKYTEVVNGKKNIYYINRDGSIDWDSFYDDWEKIPDDYYLYIGYVEGIVEGSADETAVLEKEFAIARSFFQGESIIYEYEIFYLDDTFTRLVLSAHPEHESIHWLKLDEK